MIFPIAVKFKEILEGNITAENEKAILSLIKKSIEKRSADNIVVEENTISYKGSTSPWQGALFGGLSGTFSFIERDGKSYLTYEIRMKQLFIATSIMSVVMGIFSQIWWVGLVAFAWLCGMNWVISILRHSALLADIATDIDEVFFDDSIKVEGNHE